MTHGQAFQGYAAVIRRTAQRLDDRKNNLLTIPLGGTAIGTGLGAVDSFGKRVFHHLANITGLDVQPTPDPFDGMQNLDELQRLSSELETGTTALAKISKDLILLSSGPNGGLNEIDLPPVQPGSSIMPGKVNPVLPMAMIQLAQVVHGNHCAIVMACQDGMLEINHYENTIASRLMDSLYRMTELLPVFAEKCIRDIQVNEQQAQRTANQGRTVDPQFKRLFRPHPVGEPGKVIMMRLVVQHITVIVKL